MKCLKIVLGLVVVAGLMAAVASPAMAVPRWVHCVKAESGEGHYNSGFCDEPGTGWETRELEGTIEVTSSVELDQEDSKVPEFYGGAVEYICSAEAIGWISNPASKGEPGAGGIASLRDVLCKISSERHGGCEEGKAPSGLWINLPWGSRLVEREKEVRDELVSGPKKETGNGEPGWLFECTIDLEGRTDQCEHSGNTMDVISSRVTGGIELRSDGITEREAMGTCTLGGTGAELVSEATILHIPIGPKEEEKTSPRWMHCVKVGSTEGKYSSGLCDGSGKGWEASQLEGTSEVTSSGELTLEDSKATGGAVRLTCSGTGVGWVANPTGKSEPGQGGTTSLSNIKCEFSEGKHGSCEEAKGVRAIPRNLPWGSRLRERGGEARDEIVSGPKKEEGNGEPGWAVECTTGGVLRIADICEHQGNTMNVTANGTTGKIESTFDERTKEETMATCTVGGAEAGLASGTILSQIEGGNALRVLVANGEAEVALAPRWMHCVKVGSTEGRYSSGFCDESGKGWEAGVLEGTSEVTSSGELTLEDSKATGGAVRLTCSGTGVGWVANPTGKSEPGQGGTTSLSNIKCEFSEGKHGSCEEAKGVRAIPRNLPWGSRLRERGGEARDEIVSGPKKEEGNGEPGWAVECTTGGVLRIADICEHQGNTMNVTANRATGKIESIFDERTKAETMATCTVGGAEAGLVSGTILSQLKSGDALWVLRSGNASWVLAPNLGT